MTKKDHMPTATERAAASRSGSRMMHGGFAEAAEFTDFERAAFDALVDTLIPPEDRWPNAATIGVTDAAARFLVPDDYPVSFYPHFRVGWFRGLLGRLGVTLIDAEVSARVTALAEFQRDDPELFDRIRDFVYYVYYGQPAVVRLIATRTTYGRRYTGRSQPAGYDQGQESWGSRAWSVRGAFIPTDQVRRAGQDESGGRSR